MENMWTQSYFDELVTWYNIKVNCGVVWRFTESFETQIFSQTLGQHFKLDTTASSLIIIIISKWFYFEVKCATVKFMGTKVPCTLGWPYTGGTGLYCDYFVWFVFCAVVVLTCFGSCGCVYVLVLLCVGVLVICVLVFTVFCIVCTVFLYCFVYVFYLFCLY